MGAAIDCGDHNGMTPLHLAAANGDEGVLEVLNMPLTETEQEAIRRSAATLAEVQSKIVFGRQ